MRGLRYLGVRSHSEHTSPVALPVLCVGSSGLSRLHGAHAPAATSHVDCPSLPKAPVSRAALRFSEVFPRAWGHIGHPALHHAPWRGVFSREHGGQHAGGCCVAVSTLRPGQAPCRPAGPVGPRAPRALESQPQGLVALGGAEVWECGETVPEESWASV